MTRLDEIAQSPAADPRSWKKDEIASAAARLTPDIGISLRYFVFGLISLAVFGTLLPFFAGEILAQHHYTHRAVAFTHLLVLGWIGATVIGATIQLVPVALGERLYSDRLAKWTFIFHAVGVTGMVLGFWIWNFRLLLWFAVLLMIGFSLFVYNVGQTLKKIARHDPVSVHIATALFYLVLTFFAGQYLMHDKITPFSPFNVIAAIHAHAHLGALGWFVMMIVGVSYRLVPMFSLSTIQSARRIWLCYGLLNAGILASVTGIALQAPWRPVAVLLVAAALGLWMGELVAILRARKRPHLDGTLKQSFIAAGHVPVLVGLGFWLSWPEKEPTMLVAQAQTAYGLLGLLGFITLFIMAMLYKIIPFLVWYELYPPLVGLQPVPKLYELYSIGLQRWSLAFFLAGLWTTAVSVSFAPLTPLPIIQAGAGTMGIGLVLFVLNMSLPLARWFTGSVLKRPQ